MYPGKMGGKWGCSLNACAITTERGIPGLSAGHEGTCLSLLLKDDWLFKAKIKIIVMIRFITYVDIK